MATSGIGMVCHHDLLMGFFNLVSRGVFPVQIYLRVKHKKVEFLHMLQRNKFSEVRNFLINTMFLFRL